MVWVVGSCCVELVDLTLLGFFDHVLNFKLGGRIDLLVVQVGWHTQFILLEVFFVLLSVEGTVHDFDIDLELLSVYFLEVAQCKSPQSTLYLNCIALFVELLGKVLDGPDKQWIFATFLSLLHLFFNHVFLLHSQKLKN